MALRPTPGPPDLLVLRALGLGDLLTGVPALRALRAGFPGHRITLAAPEPLRPLMRLAGCVDRLLDSRGLDPVPWSGRPPELAVNLHGSGPESHRLLQALTPGRLVAFANEEAGVAGPAWDDDEHEVRRWGRLLTEELDLPADPADLHLQRPQVPAEVTGAVVVHPGAAYPVRRWPADRFAAVARWAAATGRPVRVTGSAAERPLAEEVARAAGLAEGAVLAGETDLEELAALVVAADLVVCGDTGTAHLASAYATPSVVLFGPTPPDRWGPPAAGPHAVLWRRGRDEGVGDPWAAAPDPALLRIDVEDVVEAGEEVLSRAGSTRSAACGSAPGAARRTSPASA